MTGEEVVREIQETYAEWFEDNDKPLDLLVAILANKLAGAALEVQYLRKRVDYERVNTR